MGKRIRPPKDATDRPVSDRTAKRLKAADTRPVFRMTGTQLRKWRMLKAAFYPTMDWTQRGASLWWGCTERGWRRYESNERKIPWPLVKKIIDEDDQPARIVLHGVLPPELQKEPHPADERPLTVEHVTVLPDY